MHQKKYHNIADSLYERSHRFLLETDVINAILDADTSKQCPKFWFYNSKTLWDIRKELENV